MHTSEKLKYNADKLAKRLRRLVGQAIDDFKMIEAHDKVMVCLSGGKDSYTLLDILMSLQRSAPIPFELIAVNLDQKQPDYPEHVLPEYLSKLGIPFHIVQKDTYSVVKRVLTENQTMCSLCSRLRRGNLYTIAQDIGATKIALGHHREDILETFFLNLFFGGKISSMPAKLKSDNEEHILIRPLAYCKEKDIARYALHKQFPIIPCRLCGSQPNMQRAIIKDMLTAWDKTHPGRLESIFNALANTCPSQLLDRRLFDFESLKKSM